MTDPQWGAMNDIPTLAELFSWQLTNVSLWLAENRSSIMTR